MKMSSMATPNSSAMRKASGKEGSYLPVSMALTLWRRIELEELILSGDAEYRAYRERVVSKLIPLLW